MSCACRATLLSAGRPVPAITAGRSCQHEPARRERERPREGLDVVAPAPRDVDQKRGIGVVRRGTGQDYGLRVELAKQSVRVAREPDMKWLKWAIMAGSLVR